MKHSATLLFAAVLAFPQLAPAIPLVTLETFRPVPVIPHGQDWGIVLPPQPVISQTMLSLEEVSNIIPRVPAISQDLQITEIGAALPNRDQTTLARFGYIVTGILLLLAGYDLIPRAHSSTLRVRSLHYKQDLFR